MSDAVNRFYNSIENVEAYSQSALVEIFVYFLTVEMAQEMATPAQVVSCFTACDLAVPKNAAARLSEGLKGKPSRYIKSGRGYKLQRHMRETLSRKLGAEKVTVQTSTTLRSLENKLLDGATKDFLKEAIDCFEVGANRATIVMIWILAMDHLYAYIMSKKLKEFNAALVKERGVKISEIINIDDFSDIRENKFIEICRAAGLISNDVRKILEQKLGTRNSCAHPSAIKIGNAKVIDFVEDIVENIIIKYKL